MVLRTRSVAKWMAQDNLGSAMNRGERSDFRMASSVALIVAVGLIGGGCSSSSASLPFEQTNYLGGPRADEASGTGSGTAAPQISSGKVLSAIVFERVTGLEVDPSRLIEP